MNPNPFITSKDPVWHRWIDGLVILTVGVAMGVVAAQLFVSYETTTVTRTTRRTPLLETPKEEKAGEVKAPDTSVKFEEI